jgi:LytS/YehU family sensor histidine kinase
LIPKYLKTNNYIFYTFWLLILLAVASTFIQISLVFLLQTKSFGEQFFSLFSSHFFTAAFYVGITSLFKFVKDWIQLQQINLKLSQIEREKLEAELNTLKSQLNPHFLFNCLNNIYSLALNNSPKTPDIVLKLSEMMRYVLYESRENFIPVKKELDFMANFIELQKIRLNNKIDINYTIEGEIPDLKVIPLIFEPFIDNAFKHGIHNPADQPFIHIEVKFIDSVLKFSVRNNFTQLNNKKTEPKSSGIGLKNIEKRLNYLYLPEEYIYEVTKSENLFEVRIEVQLK